MEKLRLTAVQKQGGITVSIIVEYKPKLKLYDKEDRTPEKMLALDLKGFKEAPLAFFNNYDKVVCKGEIIP